MDKIRILHISDLHYEKNNENIERIIESFFNDITKLEKIDLVIFSGDLVQRGEKKLFSEVKENFIMPLLEKLTLTINDFFIVPGNHETNRKKIDDYEFELKQSLNDEKLRKIFNFSDSGLFFKKLEDFNRFKKNLGQESTVLNKIYSVHNREIKGKKLAISCLNSSLFCRKNDNEIDEGNLILSEYQINETIKKIRESDIKICVFHHGLNCLKLEDRNNVENILYKNYDLLLTGHFHEETMEESIINNHSLIKSVVKSLYDEKNKSGYSVITIGESELKINFRCYFPKRNEYDVDLDIFPNGEYVTKINSFYDKEKNREYFINTSDKNKMYSLKKMENFLEKFYSKIESIECDFLLEACPMIPEQDYYMLISLQEMLDTFIWKDEDFLPLIKEFKNMSLIIKNLITIMSGHMEYLSKDKMYRVSKEYKKGYNPNYDEDVKKYNKINFLIGNLVVELICSENYIKELTEEYFKDFSLKKEIKKRSYIFSETEIEVYNYKSEEHHFIDYFENELVSLENFSEYLDYIFKQRGTYIPSWGYYSK